MENKDFDFIKKSKYPIIFLVIVFLAQLLELASDKIGNSTIYHYFMYLCYFVMAFLLLSVKKEKSNLSRIERIKRSLLNHPLRNLIIDTKKGYTDISKKLLSNGNVPEEPKKLEERISSIEQFKNGMYGAGKEKSILDGEITYTYFDCRDSSLPIIRERLKILYDYLAKTDELEDVSSMFCYGSGLIYEHEHDLEEWKIISKNLTEDKIRILHRKLMQTDIDFHAIKFDIYSGSKLKKTLSLSDF